jgi:hypothetical protein
MRNLIIIGLILFLGCVKPKPRYFVACGNGDSIAVTVEVRDSLTGIKLANEVVDAGLFEECRAYKIH